MSDLIDQARKIGDGELWVKPLNPDGSTLSDPYSIFNKPSNARSVLASQQSKLGHFEEAKGHLFLGNNLVVDQGRQVLANLVGGLGFPANTWIVTQTSWGSYDTVPLFTDTTLSPQPVISPATPGGLNEIIYGYDGMGNPLKKMAIYSVDWPQPFIVRFEAILSSTQANGTLIREMGLWTSNLTLFARKVFPAISKTSSFSLSFLWRIRL